jgi:hypothetical protein
LSARSVAVLLALGAVLVPASAAPAAPRVHAMIAWADGGVTGPRTLTLSSLRVGRCSLGAGLPIAVLRGFGKPFRTEGSCEALYVSQVGRDRERGQAGWVYKVGRRLPGVSSSSSRARVRSGAHVTWFWCRRAAACQRTLSTSVRSRGGRVTVRVMGYDDRGHGKRIAGASVRVRRPGRTFSVRTGRRGTATFRTRRGYRIRLGARKHGLVPAYPRTVRVR